MPGVARSAEVLLVSRCSANRACVELERYVSVPRYLREALDAYGLGHPSERGIYE